MTINPMPSYLKVAENLSFTRTISPTETMWKPIPDQPAFAECDCSANVLSLRSGCRLFRFVPLLNTLPARLGLTWKFNPSTI